MFSGGLLLKHSQGLSLAGCVCVGCCAWTTGRHCGCLAPACECAEFVVATFEPVCLVGRYPSGVAKEAYVNLIAPMTSLLCSAAAAAF